MILPKRITSQFSRNIISDDHRILVFRHFSFKTFSRFVEKSTDHEDDNNSLFIFTNILAFLPPKWDKRALQNFSLWLSPRFSLSFLLPLRDPFIVDPLFHSKFPSIRHQVADIHVMFVSPRRYFPSKAFLQSTRPLPILGFILRPVSKLQEELLIIPLNQNHGHNAAWPAMPISYPD